MALASTITLDPGTGIKNPFNGTYPANMQEQVNNETLTLAIVSYLFATTSQVWLYDSASGTYKATGGAQPKMLVQRTASEPDPRDLSPSPFVPANGDIVAVKYPDLPTS